MNPFQYKHGRLFAEDVDLTALADEAGTPLYVYSTAALKDNFKAFAGAFPAGTLIAYAMKANGNLAVLKTLARLGAGADVVSGGELKKALLAGIPASRIVFSGVGKTRDEMRLGLDAGIHQFNVESEPEFEALNAVANSIGKRAPVAVRINPDVRPRTHAKIATGGAETKFGIPWDRAREAYALAARLPGIEIAGVDVHIGSQIAELEPFELAFARLGELVGVLRGDGHRISRADLGGGLGVPYGEGRAPPDPHAYAQMATRLMRDLGVALIVEPGRAIAATAGLLLSRVILVKQGASRHFAILDAGMNDLLRPALYDAYHEIIGVKQMAPDAPRMRYDVVGPVCETADLFGRDRDLPVLEASDLVAILGAGAYGAAMASAYNMRPPAAEVLVNGAVWCLVRPKLSDDALIGQDRLPNWLDA